jgi:hypothetical protein
MPYLPPEYKGPVAARIYASTEVDPSQLPGALGHTVPVEGLLGLVLLAFRPTRPIGRGTGSTA